MIPFCFLFHLSVSRSHALTFFRSPALPSLAHHRNQVAYLGLNLRRLGHRMGDLLAHQRTITLTEPMQGGFDCALGEPQLHGYVTTGNVALAGYEAPQRLEQVGLARGGRFIAQPIQRRSRNVMAQRRS